MSTLTDYKDHAVFRKWQCDQGIQAIIDGIGQLTGLMAILARKAKNHHQYTN